jgi:hypothetical protein
MSKTYVIDIWYYIPTDNLDKFISESGISDSEYYGGYELVEVEEDEEEEDNEWKSYNWQNKNW